MENDPNSIKTTVLTPNQPGPIINDMNLPAIQPHTIITPEASPQVAPITTTPPSPAQKRKISKSSLILSGIIGVALSIAAYLFFFYLPSTPESVWSSGLGNSGKAIDAVLNNFLEEENYAKLTKSEVNIKADANWAGYDFIGSFNSKFDESKAANNLSVDLSNPSEADQNFKFNLDLIASIKEGSYFPNIFFKLTGLDSFAAETEYSEYTKLIDDKWIRVSSEYLDETAGSYITGLAKDDEPEQITSADVADYTRTSVKIFREYVFTDSPEKAVINNDGFITDEELEGLKTYKYNASLNPENMKKFCVELTNSLLGLPATKKLSGMNDEEVAKEKKDTEEGCNKQVERMEDGTSFLIWMDADHKLLHKIRIFADQADKTSYVDIGQVYQSSKELNFFTNYYDESEQIESKFNFSLNTETYTSTGTVSVTKKTDNGFEANLSIEIKPLESDVPADEPADYTDIQEILDQMFGSTYSAAARKSPGGIQARARDTERQTDINAIRSHLEAYYANNGYYPTLAQLNDPAFRSDNMQGLEEDALKDPSGTSFSLSAAATASSYGYKAGKCVANECQTYMLEAVLDEDGAKYTKQSLN